MLLRRDPDAHQTGGLWKELIRRDEKPAIRFGPFVTGFRIAGEAQVAPLSWWPFPFVSTFNDNAFLAEALW